MTKERGYYPDIDKSRNILSECGINIQYVEGQYFRRGAHHNVYRYNPPDEPPKVVKVPNFSGMGFPHSFEETKHQADLISSYFPGIAVPCEVRASQKNYCVIMDFMQGRVLTTYDLQGEDAKTLRGELEEIIRSNQKMRQLEGVVVDLVGLDGVKDLAHKMITPKAPPIRLANLVVDERTENDEHIRLVGYDIIPMDTAKHPIDKVKSFAIYRANTHIIDKYIP